ncbi:alkylation response protein AidB-like acyl-CoA dehydrogenase [Thermocatellispora tengchongensis]|uniref:Alkylation response protein AidB-like acyl-CoA dehydrogenase n=1 Tax=Thermocatellispora tengchongensis TaxID=1073253 RepID=A0A840PST4_9ACTN|nr:acyl-CoA dehydrogenase family protein [Thermocatellispora tengchongensis]MBB5140197.1 alkylation response protein AidB-like acyl-CoA dehydrogenase [Thermocatellispora tengchongensis]
MSDATTGKTLRLHTGGGAAELVARARALEEVIAGEARAAEERGRLTDGVVEALHDAGIFGMWLPAPLGGAELSPGELIDVLAAVSYADPSTGWVVMATAMVTGTAGAYLGEEAVREIFGGGGRLPLIAGQGTRAGTAVREDGGYRLSGRWSFGSGILHSSYAHSLGVVEDTGEGRIFITPMEDVKLLGNWDVLGLRATGSVDYAIDGAFVPEAYTHVVTCDMPLRGGALYRLGVLDQALVCHSGWAVGVGRRLLDELGAHARARAGRAGQLAGSDAFHTGYARAEAGFRAAEALVREAWGDAERTLDAGEALSVRQETLIRLALNHITWTLAGVADFVYASCGTSALRDGPVQRLFRDVHTGTQHITSGPRVLAECGRELAGLAPGHVWHILDLAIPS